VKKEGKGRLGEGARGKEEIRRQRTDDSRLRLMASAYVNSAVVAEAIWTKSTTTAGQVCASRRTEGRMWISEW